MPACTAWPGMARPSSARTTTACAGSQPDRTGRARRALGPCHTRATQSGDRRCRAVPHGASVRQRTWVSAGDGCGDHTLLSSRPQVRILLGARSRGAAHKAIFAVMSGRCGASLGANRLIPAVAKWSSLGPTWMDTNRTEHRASQALRQVSPMPS
jgi:hypothetical protein